MLPEKLGLCLRWEGWYGSCDDLQERSGDELKILLVLREILIWCFRRVKVVTVARRQRSHGLDEWNDQVTQVTVPVDLSEGRQEPRASRIAPEQGSVAVCVRSVTYPGSLQPGNSPVRAISLSIIAFKRAIKEFRVSNKLSRTLMIWSTSPGGQTSHIASASAGCENGQRWETKATFVTNIRRLDELEGSMSRGT